MSSKFQASLSFLIVCMLFAVASAEDSNVVLDEFGTTELKVTLKENDNVRDISVNRQNSNPLWVFSLALTSFDCDIDGTYLEVNGEAGSTIGKVTERWNCSSKGDHHRHSSGNDRLNSNDILTDLKSAEIRLIVPPQSNVSTSMSKRNTEVSLIAAMYFVTSATLSCNGRGRQYFDCTTRSVMCPNSGSNGFRYIEFDNPYSGETRRCVPLGNKCNDVPSCGYAYNVDEHDAVCHPEEFCQLIFDWAFIVTRSLVAVIFILIPTVVIFLLFHRRQVALQRARLLRERTEQLEAQRSVEIINMQNKYANDLPPTYDDLYDTKDPPPCFCAVQASASPVDNSQLPPTSPDSPASPASPASHVNPSFECTCQK